MAELNSAGLGQHKLKSIYVSANLLTSWTNERLHEEINLKRKVTTVLLQCVLGLVVIPLSAIFQNSQGHGAANTAKRLVDVRKAHDDFSSRYKAIEPRLEAIKNWQIRSGHAQTFFNHFVYLNNHARGVVAISALKLEANGGELSIKMSGKSPTIEANRYFLELSGADPGVISSVQTSIQASKIGKVDVYGFEYQKKVKLSNE